MKPCPSSSLLNIPPALLPGEQYLSALPPGPSRLAEPKPKSGPDFCERHLQAVWADDRFRPAGLHTLGGERIEVIHPGHWNLGPGPDFQDCQLRIGEQTDPLTGDLEIDIQPSGWHQHGHDRNPQFQSVRFHLTYLEPAGSVPGLPETVVQFALGPALESDTGFSFEHIDLTAYPFAVHPSSQQAADRFRPWTPEKKFALLDAAGRARLLEKGRRLAQRCRVHDPEHQLYEEWMHVLGYRKNSLPFRKTAQLLSPAWIRHRGLDLDTIYACLLHLSGLAPIHHRGMDPAAAAYHRRLADHWWHFQEDFETRPLPVQHWKLQGIRPLNHPRRRLAAAASLLARQPGFFLHLTELKKQKPADIRVLLENLPLQLRHPFWDSRQGLKSPGGAKIFALVGRDRMLQFFTNVIVPLACFQDSEKSADWIAELKPEPANEITRRSAHFFFGPDASRSLLEVPLHQQGLIQLFQDFVLDPLARDPERLKERLDHVEQVIAQKHAGH